MRCPRSGSQCLSVVELGLRCRWIIVEAFGSGDTVHIVPCCLVSLHADNDRVSRVAVPPVLHAANSSVYCQ